MGCCIPELAGDLVRTFVCFEIPEEHKKWLANWMNERSSESREIRWVAPPTLHVTLKFCGERLPETVKKLTENLSKIRQQGAFSIGIEGCGGFPDMAAPRVIWTGINGDIERLTEVFSDVEYAANKAGIPKERAKYSPHLTLGRRNAPGYLPETVRSSISDHQIKLAAWTVTEIVLMKSRLTPRGSEYTPLGLFKI